LCCRTQDNEKLPLCLSYSFISSFIKAHYLVCLIPR
jgi:hypothetical protein